MRYFFPALIFALFLGLSSCQKNKEQFELPIVLNKSDQIAVASNPLAASLYLGTLPFYSEIDITEQFFIENNSAQITNSNFVKKIASTTPINQLEIFIAPPALLFVIPAINVIFIHSPFFPFTLSIIRMNINHLFIPKIKWKPI